MFVMDTLSVNRQGNLELGGCDVADLAKEHGTPLYLMDEDKIKSNCRVYTKAINDYFDDNGLVLYASKALSCKYIYKIVNNENMGIDVVSGGELYTALAAGFPSEKIYFHGNNKTVDELKMAIDKGVGRIVVDNEFELENINLLAGYAGKKIKVSFRVKPGVEAHTHEFVQTGQIDSKFGVALETGEAENIIAYANSLKNIEVVGVHCHIGSQIFDSAPFELAAEKMTNFIADLWDKHSIKITELNLGGGFGIKYIKGDDPVLFDEYIKMVSVVVKSVCSRRSIDLPFIVLEPGRSIVASAGLTVYTVGGVKEIPDIRTYVSVDGGMTDNPRYIMYGAKYDAVLVQNPLGTVDKEVTIAGKCCESGDVLIPDIKLPKVNVGDLLAVLTTGAYNYSMANNYNRVPRPPIVMVSGGKSNIAVKRESYNDLIKNDM